MDNSNQFPIKVARKNADGEVEIINAILEVGDGKDVLWRLIVNDEGAYYATQMQKNDSNQITVL